MLPENYEQILIGGGAIIKDGFLNNIDELTHAAEDHESCMKAMDDLGVPRFSADGVEYSIFGRACWMGRTSRTVSN